MKNARRIFAWIALAAVVLLCVAPMFIAMITKNPDYFRASVACVIIAPVLFFVIVWFTKIMKPAKSPLIDAVIFDVGMVLIDFQWRRVMKELEFSDETIAYLDKNLIHNPLWNQFDEGIRPYQDVVDQFCQEHPQYENEIRTFIKHKPETIVKFPYTDAWIDSLRASGYQTYIVSNWSVNIYENCKDTSIDFHKKMEGCIWSYQEKCAKPDLKIYQLLIDRYHLDPSRCVFLDDRQANLDAAAQLGIHTLLVTKDHKDTLNKLAALGVK